MAHSVRLFTAVFLLIPAAGRLLDGHVGSLNVGHGPAWQLNAMAHGNLRSLAVTEPLLRQPRSLPVQHDITNATVQIAKMHGRADADKRALVVSRDVALSDPVLQAAVAEGAIPPWVRGLIAIIVLGSLLLVFFMAISEESNLGGGSTAELAPCSLVDDAHLCNGSSLPELQTAAAGNMTVVSLIKARAVEQPGKAAILDADGNVVLTYADLNSRIEALAKALLDGGLKKGDIVGLIFKPSPAFVVASLGVMHAGLVWAPLDGDTPAAWRKSQLSNMGARLQLVAGDMCSLFQSESPEVPVCSLDVTGSLIQGQVRPAPVAAGVSRTPDNSALIIHTSGSTGKPKAVLYSHHTLLHGVLTWKSLCQMDRATVALLKSSPTWAVIEYELFPALVAGGSIVADAECQRNWPQLARVLLERKVSVLVTSAPVLQLLVDDWWTSDSVKPAALKHIMNVGAGIPLKVCKAVCSTLANGVQVHNGYGCTETTMTLWSFSSERGSLKSDVGLAPAGLPQPESEVHLVVPGQELKKVLPGQAGEICFGGHYMSLGYLGNEAATSERFMRNPFGNGMLYRTGDVGRWVVDPLDASNHVVQVTGRVDRQTNIRGLRVAPEDIEAVIRKVAGVGEVAVVIGEAEGVSPCLVAFVSPGSGCSDQLEDPVKKHCTTQLPRHMCPEFVLQLAEFPKLANGKVNMLALATKASETILSEENSAPDSLGLARKAGKEAINELDTMAAARGVGILLVLAFHWYYMPIAWYYPAVVTRQFVYPSVLFINIGLGMNWCMQLFVLTSAFQDRAGAEQRRSGEWKGDVLVLALLMFMHGPLPKLLEFLCWARHGFSEPMSAYHIEPQTGVRWYFYYFLICRAMSQYLFGPCLTQLQKGGDRCVAVGSTLVVFACFAVAWAGETKTADGTLWWQVPDACPGGFAQHSPWVRFLAYFLPGTNVGPGNEIAYCPLLMHQTLLWYLAVYAAGWWYSRAIVRWFKARTPSMPLIVPVVACICVMYAFYCLEQYQILTTQWEEPNASTWCLSYLIDLCIASVLIFTLSCAISGKWLHYSGLVFMGRYSLGSYVFHVYMFGAMGLLSASNPKALFHITEVVGGIQAVEQFPGASYGIPQLAVIIAYPVIFMLTLGPAFQIGFVSAYNYSIKAIGDAWQMSGEFESAKRP